MSFLKKVFGGVSGSAEAKAEPYDRINRAKIITVMYFTDTNRSDAAAFLQSCNLSKSDGGIEIVGLGLRYRDSQIAQKSDEELCTEIRRAVSKIKTHEGGHR